MQPGQKSLFLRLVALIVIAVIPVAVSLAWRATSQWREVQVRIDAELAGAARLLAGAVERDLQSSTDALKVLSQSEIFEQGRVEAMGRLLGGRPRRDWDSIFLLDRDGTVVLDTAPARAAEVPRDLRHLHAKAVRARGAVIGSVQGPQPASAIALPLNQGANVRYVLGARLNESQWQRTAMVAVRPQGARAVIAGDGGRVIGDSGATVPADGRGEVYGASEQVAGTAWRAQVSIPAAPIDEARRRALLAALARDGGAILAGVLLASLLAWRVAARSAAP